MKLKRVSGKHGSDHIYYQGTTVHNRYCKGQLE